MKKTTFILGLALLMMVSLGWECSMTTADMSDIKFAKDKEGKQPAASFDTGKDIYGIVEATGIPSGKHKIAWKVTYENVAGKTKGEEFAGGKPMEFEGSSQLWTQFSSPLPGDYKVEATLTDSTGKTISTKSAVVKVTGSAPSAPATSDDKSKDDDN